MYVPHSTEFMKDYFRNQFPYLIDTDMHRDKFFAIIEPHYPKHSHGYNLIYRAYHDAKDAFRDMERDTGERVFEHQRRIALLAINFLNVHKNANLIATIFLHDNPEDKPEWTIDRIHHEYNPIIAANVAALTKPDVKLFNGDKRARDVAYHNTIEAAGRDVILCKLADFFDNFFTVFPPAPEEKRQRKLFQYDDFFAGLSHRHLILNQTLLWLSEIHRREPEFTGFIHYKAI